MEVHLRQDVAIQIHPRGDLHQFDPFRAAREYRPFGDVPGLLTEFLGIRAVVRDLFEPRVELMKFAFLADAGHPVLPDNIQPAGGERTAENDLLGVLGDVDKSAHADDATIKETDVDAPLGVHLGKGEEGQIEPPPS